MENQTAVHSISAKVHTTMRSREILLSLILFIYVKSPEFYYILFFLYFCYFFEILPSALTIFEILLPFTITHCQYLQYVSILLCVQLDSDFFFIFWLSHFVLFNLFFFFWTDRSGWTEWALVLSWSCNGKDLMLLVYVFFWNCLNKKLIYTTMTILNILHCLFTILKSVVDIPCCFMLCLLLIRVASPFLCNSIN